MRFVEGERTPERPLPKAILKAVTAGVPQLGTRLSLPVHVGLGENIELTSTFTTDGSLADVGYGRPTSAAGASST